MAKWNEARLPTAICLTCLFFVNPPVVKAIYNMRAQIQSLSAQLAEANDNIRKLYQAQQELEQKLYEQ